MRQAFRNISTMKTQQTRRFSGRYDREKLTVSDFSTFEPLGSKGFILAVPGGYFGGFIMKDCFLIVNRDGALVINRLTTALKWRKDYGGTDIFSIEVSETGINYKKITL